MYDYLIVGSGLFGATFARLATDNGKRCLVIDRRKHTGGNVHCDKIEGINVHRYGPHIFHTSNKRVWDFVNRFAELNRFTLMTVADYKGKLFNLPFNMNTFYTLWGVRKPEEAFQKIEEQRHVVSMVNNLEDQAISLVGVDVYNTLIKGYTEKQWGRCCRDLPPFIIRRLPVRYTFDNNYFNDLYQGVPIGGYNVLIDNLLEGIEVKTDVDFFNGLREEWKSMARVLVYTGKIDSYYGYRYGKLEYRSLLFDTQVLDLSNHQGIAIKNFTDISVPYTRIVEHKHFECFGEDVYRNPHTVITNEYPCEYSGANEAYYPINDVKNTQLYEKYKLLSAREKDVIFGGRLAEYKYYNMDQVIERAMCEWNNHQMGNV